MERKEHLIFVENRAVITLQNGAMEEDDKGLGQKSTIQKSDKGLEDLLDPRGNKCPGNTL
jgi:hypothetical protein